MRVWCATKNSVVIIIFPTMPLPYWGGRCELVVRQRIQGCPCNTLWPHDGINYGPQWLRVLPLFFNSINSTPQIKHNKTKTANNTANQQMDKDFTFPGINFKGNSNVLLSLPQTMTIQNPKCQFCKSNSKILNREKAWWKCRFSCVHETFCVWNSFATETV